MTDDILDLFRQGHGAAVVIIAFLLLWGGARLLILWDARRRRIEKAKRERESAIYQREAAEQREWEKERWAALTDDEKREERRAYGEWRRAYLETRRAAKQQLAADEAKRTTRARLKARGQRAQAGGGMNGRQYDQVPALAADLVRRQVTVIFACACAKGWQGWCLGTLATRTGAFARIGFR
jgi:hypothetical protein